MYARDLNIQCKQAANQLIKASTFCDIVRTVCITHRPVNKYLCFDPKVAVLTFNSNEIAIMTS